MPQHTQETKRADNNNNNHKSMGTSEYVLSKEKYNENIEIRNFHGVHQGYMHSFNRFKQF